MIEVSVEGLMPLHRQLETIGGYTKDTYEWGRVIANYAKAPLEGATSTWDPRPPVRVEVLRGGFGYRGLALGVTVDSPHFHFVDRGTRPHWIRPKGEGYPLRFNGTFSPKSRPNSLRAYPGYSGPPVVRRWAVYHPGSRARNFTKLALELARDRGVEAVRQNIQRLLAGSRPMNTSQRAPISTRAW
jgi:hypothetical protein